ncbi:unnamed protein product [Sphagnum jensenii]|uniref:Uncharacterized protein n=1 Tax=Sphagnum jensenii TaxID=128206 RepID=A0ABP1B137_9BRYO
MACAFKSMLQKGETKFSKVLAKIAKAEDAGKNVVDSVRASRKMAAGVHDAHWFNVNQGLRNEGLYLE